MSWQQHQLEVEGRAFNARALAAVVGFFGGALTTFSALLYVLIRFVVPEEGWWALLMSLHHLVIFPLLGGGALTWLLMVALVAIQHRAGMFRCHMCGRILRSDFAGCVCTPSKARPPLHRSRWRCVLRRLRFAVVVWLALLVASVVTVLLSPAHSERYPPMIRAVFFHMLNSALVAALLGLAEQTLEVFKCERRFRLRSRIVVQFLVGWVLLTLLTFAVCGWIP